MLQDITWPSLRLHSGMGRGRAVRAASRAHSPPRRGRALAQARKLRARRAAWTAPGRVRRRGRVAKTCSPTAGKGFWFCTSIKPNQRRERAGRRPLAAAPARAGGKQTTSGARAKLVQRGLRGGVEDGVRARGKREWAWRRKRESRGAKGRGRLCVHSALCAGCSLPAAPWCAAKRRKKGTQLALGSKHAAGARGCSRRPQAPCQGGLGLWPLRPRGGAARRRAPGARGPENCPRLRAGGPPPRTSPPLWTAATTPPPPPARGGCTRGGSHCTAAPPRCSRGSWGWGRTAATAGRPGEGGRFGGKVLEGEIGPGGMQHARAPPDAGSSGPPRGGGFVASDPARNRADAREARPARRPRASARRVRAPGWR
jgi:hypothetical protein